MSTTTVLPQLTQRGSSLSKSDQWWLLMVQQQHPLITVNTSAGNQKLSLPPAGANQSTGQTNQNKEITFRKTSPDANTATITGSPDGNIVLTSSTGAGSVVKLKSDGTSWWVTKWP